MTEATVVVVAEMKLDNKFIQPFLSFFSMLCEW